MEWPVWHNVVYRVITAETLQIVSGKESFYIHVGINSDTSKQGRSDTVAEPVTVFHTITPCAVM
jgi:hypothetical protein